MAIGLCSAGFAIATGAIVYKIIHPIEEKYIPMTANVDVDVSGILNSIAAQVNKDGEET